MVGGAVGVRRHRRRGTHPAGAVQVSSRETPSHPRAAPAGYAEHLVETRLVDGLEVNFKLSPTQ